MRFSRSDLPITADSSASPDTGALSAWLLAIRPKTLACAVVPVLVGSAVAARAGGFDAVRGGEALLGAIAIQIGTNLANDVFDFEQGADTADRLGPPRAVASGLLTPRAVRIGALVAFAIATLVGSLLVAVRGPWVLAIGLGSIASGVMYTRGKRSLAYIGMGDVFVFVFFGVVAVAGTAFVESGSVSALAFAASIPIGAIATVLLVVNNLRDRYTDEAAEKRTLVVRFGKRFARRQILALLVLAYGVPPAVVLFGLAPPSALLPLASFPLAVALHREASAVDGRALNGTLARTARLLVVFGLLWALGIALSGMPG